MSEFPREPATWMRRCLELAAEGAGFVSPNPLVGAVLVSPEGETLGEGYHKRFGGPHAEVEAIADAEKRHTPESIARGILFVNLEPCAHRGKTPPCTDLIIRKMIRRVVIGMVDPFPAVSGAGIDRLRRAGIEVSTGVLETECKRLNEAYLHHLQTGRPLVTVKTAQSLDGFVATATGESRWISSETSRHLVHRWRAASDGILVGASTAAADNPSLTVRHVQGPQPERFVLDRLGILPPHLKLFTDRHTHRTCAVVERDVQPAYCPELERRGGRVLRLKGRDRHIDLADLLHVLGNSVETERGPIQSLLVEAGPRLATALLRDDLVDRYFLFIAPRLIGEGVPVLHDLSVSSLDEAFGFAEASWEQVGPDMLFRGYRRVL